MPDAMPAIAASEAALDLTRAVITVNKGKRSLLACDIEEAAHQAGQGDGTLLEFEFQPLFYDGDGNHHPDAASMPRQRWRLRMERVTGE